MKIISKTTNKIVIEITLSEFEKDGFDKIWDKIRDVYSTKYYKTKSIGKDEKKGIMTIILEKTPFSMLV